MIVLDAVGVVVVVGDERRPLQDAGAGAAAETVRVEALAHRLQHAVRDLLPASGTNCQGILKRGRRRKRRDRAGKSDSRAFKAELGMGRSPKSERLLTM